MLTFKRLLAASSAVVLGAGSGFATSVYAQVTSGPPQTSPGNPPIPSTTQPGTNIATPQGEAVASNFRRDATLSVMQHPREGYEARGIRAGTFLIYPQVGLTVQHDDNIFASEINEADDTIWRVAPQVTATSDWNRHALQLYARGTFNRYTDHSNENTDDYGVGANGRLDVSRDTQIIGRADFMHATEPRTSSNSPPGAGSPVQYDVWTAYAEGRHEFNRLLATVRAQAQTYDYSTPSGAASQSFRNRTVTTYAGRLDYALSPKTAMFGEIQGEKHSYDNTSIPGDINRDSTGYQALVGVNFEVTALARGDIGIGYRKETFEHTPGHPTPKDLEGFSANGQLEWFPTQLTTVTFSASRTIEDSAIASAPAYLSTNLRARVDHELLRNVILTAQVGYGDDKYSGIDKQDRRTTAGLGASYLVNRYVGVSVTYDYNKQETTKGTPINNFKDNRIGATLTVQY